MWPFCLQTGSFEKITVCNLVYIFCAFGTVSKHRYQYVPTPRAQKCRFSECHISGSTVPREIGSSDLDSPWSSDHLYTHQIHLSYVTMLQHSIKILTGKRGLRLGKLSKSVVFFIRYGLGLTGGFRMTISSLAVAYKILKNIIFGRKIVAHFVLS